MPAASPRAIASRGWRGTTRPSTAGCQGSVPWARPRASEARSCASRIASRGASRSDAQRVSPASRRARASSASAARAARSGLDTLCAAPLWRIARWKSGRADGVPSSVPTLIAPADSPNTVTFAGSPPKAAMCSRTKRSAAT